MVKGHLAAWNYFQSIDTPANKKFVANFKKFIKDKYDKDAVTDDPIEAAYMNVYFWKMACEKAGSPSTWTRCARRSRSDIEFDAPGGKVKLDPKTQHIYRPFMMGKIRDDKQFDIVYKTPDLIEPDPYPQFAFKGWSCDWTKGGVVKGEPVKIT